MFWKRRPKAPTTAPDWEQEQTNRAREEQKKWPAAPWPVDTEEDRRVLLEAQLSIDSRYAECWPLKTFANLVLLRNAADHSNTPLTQVILYLETLPVADAIIAIRSGLPLEYVAALKDKP